jgi:hypothetical protein
MNSAYLRYTHRLHTLGSRYLPNVGTVWCSGIFFVLCSGVLCCMFYALCSVFYVLCS